MDILNFETKHIPEAAALAQVAYHEQQKQADALPPHCTMPDLTRFAENGLGVVAFENGRMIGFLCCEGPFANAFRATDATGVFASMGAHAAIGDDRSKVYAAMYQTAAAKWVRAGAVSHAVCLPAHEAAVQQQFFRWGFGMRCIDAIRPMEPVTATPCVGYTFAELPREEWAAVYPLDLALNQHYCESPFFMNRTPDSLEGFLAFAQRDEGRIFAAKQQDAVCAYLLISATGETFVAAGADYRHINGAYCLPEHRGKGVYQQLLNCVINTLKQEGYTRLGVDFESINPAGSGFWLKYFTAYTHSVVRRIDERILLR